MPFTLYRSSAGSGKTFTLVKEYLKLALLEPEENYRHILAVTFTNKAAGEMKERIIKALKELSTGKNAILADMLEKDLPDISIRENSEKVLKQLLHNYSDFAVVTIDSFIYSIVKAFAIELGIHPDFEVDLGEELIIKRVVDNLIARVGTEEHITNVLLEFVRSNIDNDRSWNIDTALKSTAKEIQGHNMQYIDELSERSHIVFDDFINYVKNEVSSFQQEINTPAEKAISAINRSGIHHDDFSKGGKGNISYFRKLSTAKTPKDVVNVENGVPQAFESDIWYKKDAPADVKHAIDRLFHSELKKNRDDILSLIDEKFAPFSSFFYLLKTIYSLAVVNEIKSSLEDYKKENRTILISDFTQKVTKLIEKQTIPFIYTIAGDRYHNYLIDEFQDTSQSQWKNFNPLIDESLANNRFNMAVGDSKQAIYRWRGGDWEIIEERLCESFSKYEPEERSLAVNYRSGDAIVEFNNSFFRKIKEIFTGFKEEDNNGGNLQGDHNRLARIFDDSNLIQETTENNSDSGYVRIEFIDTTTESKQEDFAWIPGDPKPSDMDTKEDCQEKNNSLITVEKVEEIIKELANDCFEYKDITVIVRRKEEGSIIADALFEKGVPVISSESLLLSNEPLVNFLISVNTFIANRNDRIARANMFYFYHLMGIIDDEERLKLTSGIEKTFLSDERCQCKSTCPIQTIVDQAENLARMPIYELNEELIRILGFNNEKNSHYGGYIQRFLDSILDFTIKNRGDIDLFLEWWEEKKEKLSLSMSEEKNAVRILTIHKAKGLEFPAVIIPFANWDIGLKKGGKKESNLWLKADPPLLLEWDIPFLINPVKDLSFSHFSKAYNAELERAIIDNINLLYVAFTRAKERLYVLSIPPKRREERNEAKNEKKGKTSAKAGKTSKNTGEFRNIYDLLKESIGKNDEIFSENENIYEFGKMKEHFKESINKSIESEQPRNYEIDIFISQPWQNRITIRKKSQDIWLHSESLKSKKVERGILIHDALSRIGIINDFNDLDEDIDNVLTEMQNEGRIIRSEIDNTRIELKSIFLIDEVKQWFSPGWTIKSESTIITANEEIRPDRVIIKDNSAVVIDFKTGKKMDIHKNQLEKYSSVLLKMGYKDIKSCILYVDDREILHIGNIR